MIPTSAQDVVAVLTKDFRQVFQKARSIKATIKRESKAMEHPLETGATIIDHRIILPNVVELSMLLTSEDYKDVYQQVNDLFKRAELLTVQTRVDSYTSMLIEKMPHEENADVYEGISLALTLKEAKFVQAQFSALSVRQPKDSSTVQRGQQQPKTADTGTAARQSSILSRVFK